MAYASRRPLPDLPVITQGLQEYSNPPARTPVSSADMHSPDSPYYHGGFPYFPFTSRPTNPVPNIHSREENYYSPTRSILAGGTLLHKGFYDLLALATPSRLFTNANNDGSKLAAGPRYEQLPPGSPPKIVPSGVAANAAAKSTKPPPVTVPGTSTPLRKNKRISKDMVSSPTGFVHLVHASDYDQGEALLTRWGPDRMGKLGDPRWADPIKSMVRSTVQARAIAQVVGAMKPSPGSEASYEPTITPAPLRVVNGMPSVISTITTVGAGTLHSSPPLPTPNTEASSPVQQSSPTIPHPYATATTSPPPAGLSTAPSAWPVSSVPPNQPLSAHAEENDDGEIDESNMSLDPWARRRAEATSTHLTGKAPRKITPSLTTLEKAVSARIYFENLYFPLLRMQPSREQRRLAMEKEMAQLGMSEGQKELLRQRWRKNETDYLREQRAKVDVNAFVKLKTIGHGAFGVVSLVREKGSGQLFAMKQASKPKTDMLRKGQEGHVRAERDVLKGAALVSNPNGAEWIVRLFYSFQDRDHLYLVLEFMGGGDLLNLLIEKDVFEEPFARFYIAEMILAIEQCHKQGFIHRDIKPDNFLFDPNGHIKLSDFGLATDLHWAHDTSYYEQQRRDLLRKHGIDLEDGNGDATKTKRMDRREVEKIMGEGPGGVFTWREKNRKKASLAYSVCGTNSYMSPEVIRGQGYSFSCDWWSLGVILFECLYGYPPFLSNSRHVTRQKILNWKQSLKFPSKPRVSREGVDLIQQLLCEPEDRLGSQRTVSISRPNSLILANRRSGYYGQGSSVDGAELIKAHSWFRGVDWDNIHRMEAPFKPDLKSPTDTKHFDQDIPDEPLAPANGAPADATKDPMLKDKVHGEQILEVRKALAFAGFTHKSPRPITYARIDKMWENEAIGEPEQSRGRGTVRNSGSTVRGRAISM
ncbi:related to CBK1-Serine/threonine protein kinase involved in cell wall biosynthesis [Serendipita indica DSM 11827]|uniref:non-specific serine/threonine protein kinase n=1 Tax=Serendipita indica (strain DSM 11827) TaxID=1109443 RepID=G4TFC9_SERID|nr:related to CBK1-Serine/threonine protein kinase involved in cell wall biosynthesis [Serendipita indica DSM 11827]